MSKHTPGPWYAKDDGYIMSSGTDELSGVVGYFHATDGDLRLAAAAPDLLEALDRLTKWAEVMAEAQTCEHTGDHPISGARKALIKALTGESQ